MVMNKDEVFALKKNVQGEYNAKINQLESDLKKKLDAIDIVAGLVIDKPQNIISDSKIPIMRRRQMPLNYPATSSSDIVRNVIGELKGEFSITNIREKVSKIMPSLELSRNVLHNVLNKQKELGKIEVVSVGSGRSPSVFKKIE